MEVPSSIITDHVQRGDVFHSYSFKGIDHGKFFVIIGVTEEYVAGFFFVNSRIHPMLQNKPEQFNLQYILLKEDYEFLHHTSFVGADDMKRIKVTELAKSIESKETEFVTRLKDSHIEELLSLVRNSKLYTPAEKRLFFK